MRKVSLIAAVFFAVAWLAVAEDDERPTPGVVPTPGRPHAPMRPVSPGAPVQGWATPADDSDAPKPMRPSYSAPATPYYAPAVVTAPPAIPNTWQIHRTDSDTLLLNAATGQTWFLDKTGERQMIWQPIGQNAAPLPAIFPPVPTGKSPPVVAPAPDFGPNGPPRVKPADSTDGERPAFEFFPARGDFEPAFKRS
jgi:hypothetical protein